MTEPPDFDRLFPSVARSAVHLEMRDDYGGSSPAFAAWRESRPYDRSGPDAAWHALVGSVIQRGATVRRARIISEPASDYIRFEYEVTPAANLAAGEHVRWLPRQQASDLALPGNDFWLFDGTARPVQLLQRRRRGQRHRAAGRPGRRQAVRCRRSRQSGTVPSRTGTTGPPSQGLSSVPVLLSHRAAGAGGACRAAAGDPQGRGADRQAGRAGSRMARVQVLADRERAYHPLTSRHPRVVHDLRRAGSGSRPDSGPPKHRLDVRRVAADDPRGHAQAARGTATAVRANPAFPHLRTRCHPRAVPDRRIRQGQDGTHRRVQRHPRRPR